MLLPEPVGATDRTSRPASIAATTSDCPGLKASSPKTSFSVRSALSINIPPECDGISGPQSAALNQACCRIWVLPFVASSDERIKPGREVNGEIHVSSIRRRVEGAATRNAGASAADRRLREVPRRGPGGGRVPERRPLPAVGGRLQRHGPRRPGEDQQRP